jgi:hypothetical protein
MACPHGFLGQEAGCGEEVKWNNPRLNGDGKNLAVMTTGNWLSVVYGDMVKSVTLNAEVTWSGVGAGQYARIPGEF